MESSPPTISDTTIPNAPSHELVQHIYRELRRLAAGMLRRHARGAVTLQPTVLVHEAYARLCKQPDRLWQGRRHFYHAAARAMRYFLVDRARRRASVRGGGGWQRVDITVTLGGPDDGALTYEELLDMSSAIDELERAYPEMAEVVALRSLCGLTVEETAEALGVSRRTVERRWRFASSWLRQALTGSAV